MRNIAELQSHYGRVEMFTEDEITLSCVTRAVTERIEYVLTGQSDSFSRT
jgi:hypothetical protein